MAGGNTGSSAAGDAAAGGGGTAPVDPIPVNNPSDCAHLPAVGTWESVSPVGRAATAIVADPWDSAILWLGTAGHGLWKSTDCGATWAEVSSGRNHQAIEASAIVSMVVDTVHRGTLYVVAIYPFDGAWKSVNGGVDWDQLFASSPAIGNQMNCISVDPTNSLHLVVTMHANCEAPYAPTCEAVTADGGATWTCVKSPSSPEGNWEEGSNVWVLGATTWLYGGVHLWLTENSGTTWTNLTPDPAVLFGFWSDHSHTIVRASDGAYYIGSGQGIARSTDAHVWTQMPSSGRVVGVVHGNGHMYAADQWSKSLRVASESDGSAWTAFPTPAQVPDDQGAPFIEYDAAHHLLFATFGDGLWRVVTP